MLVCSPSSKDISVSCLTEGNDKFPNFFPTMQLSFNPPCSSSPTGKPQVTGSLLPVKRSRQVAFQSPSTTPARS